MIKLIKKMFALGLVTMLLWVDTVGAYTWGYEAAKTSDPVVGSDPNPPKVEKQTTTQTNVANPDHIITTTTTCSFSYKTGTSRKISLDAYDQENNSLLEKSLKFPSDYAMAAGTSIGISLIDVQYVYWQVYKKGLQVRIDKNETITKYRTRYQCIYKLKPPAEDSDNNSSGSSNERLSINPSIRNNQFATYQSNTYTKENKFQVSNQVNILVNSNNTSTNATPIVKLEEEYILDKLVDDPEDCKNLDKRDYSILAFYTFYEAQAIEESYTENKESHNTYPLSSKTASMQVVKDCVQKAVDTAVQAANSKALGAAYQVDFTNSNDIDATDNKYSIIKEEVNRTKEEVNRTKEEVNRTQTQSCYTYPDDSTEKVSVPNCEFSPGNGSYATYEKIINKLANIGENSYYRQKLYVQHFYLKDAACINVKTGEVSYIPEYNGTKVIKKSCGSEELTIENDWLDTDGDGILDQEHWHYFVPLNAKSSDEISINLLMDWHGTISRGECRYVIENNKEHLRDPNATTYLDLVVLITDSNVKPVKTRNFSGDFGEDLSSLEHETDEDKACRLTTKVTIPITQMFYNEVSEKDTVKFNGFNFYYKPIDVSNENQIDTIFPNGVKTNKGTITTPTLWSDWYQEQVEGKTTTLDLSESFDERTYYTQMNNAGKLDTPYTSWGHMNIDGTSRNIGSGFIYRENVDTNAIYKLGCGPLNINEYLDEAKTQPNPLYLEGCGK